MRAEVRSRVPAAGCPLRARPPERLEIVEKSSHTESLFNLTSSQLTVSTAERLVDAPRLGVICRCVINRDLNGRYHQP